MSGCGKPCRLRPPGSECGANCSGADWHQASDWGFYLWCRFPRRVAQTARTCQSGQRRCADICGMRRGQGRWLLCLGRWCSECCCSSGAFPAKYTDPIPVVVLARLAVDRTYQGRSLGRALVRDAAWRVVHAADAIGIQAFSCTQSRMMPRRFTSPSDLSRLRLKR